MLELSALSMLALAIGCKGCDDPADSPGATAQAEPEDSNESRLRERLALRNVDLTKVYPKRADGVVDCGEDKTCFLVMAERCEAALFEHKQQDQALLLLKKVHARYRIEGKKADGCAMQRLVLAADVELPEATRKSLESKGKSELDMTLMLTEAKALLLMHMQPRVTCIFTDSAALEIGLDAVEGKWFDQHFTEPCDVVGPEDEWPADLAPPPPPEPAAK